MVSTTVHLLRHGEVYNPDLDLFSVALLHEVLLKASDLSWFWVCLQVPYL